ncbi:MAG: DUF2520 domain-containing protein [Betaproteobacteria bacterium]|nr:DUF2520 domain-containing protein [Betaproteobacteria bacterium]
MKTLNIIGAGRVGRTLASLWEEKHTFAIQDVLDGTPHGARSAAAFIGDGRAVSWIEEMRAADVWMLTPPDGKIVACCETLAKTGLLRESDVVFHCSGALSSAELATARGCGAVVASVHPLKSIADPRDAVRSFAGTHCAAEGDPAALEVLRPAFERIGARVSEIEPRFKPVYHAASVIVCNYLVALMETGLRGYEKAGLERETALAMMEPLVRETVDNVFRLGTVKALTGPIARGDDAVVAHQLEALSSWDPAIAALYRDLGAIALDLARQQGEAGAAALERLRKLLGAGAGSGNKTGDVVIPDSSGTTREIARE